MSIWLKPRRLNLHQNFYQIYLNYNNRYSVGMGKNFTRYSYINDEIDYNGPIKANGDLVGSIIFRSIEENNVVIGSMPL